MLNVKPDSKTLLVFVNAIQYDTISTLLSNGGLEKEPMRNAFPS